MRKRTTAKAIPAIGLNESHSVELRKIKNGFIARHSHSDAKGNYKSEEVYHPQKPNLIAPVAPQSPKPTPAGRKRR